MDSGAFIADMNALQSELAKMPPIAQESICKLMDIVDLQNGHIMALLALNRKLLDQLGGTNAG